MTRKSEEASYDAGILSPAHNQEETDEENQEPSIDFIVKLAGFGGAADQQGRSAQRRHHGRWHTD